MVDNEREARYAEAIQKVPTVGGVQWPHHVSRAVVAVADAEQAELRAEVERLRALLATPGIEDLQQASAERSRAEVAEAKLRDVEALRDKWLAVNVPSAEVTSWSHYAGEALRTILARSQAPQAPAEQEATYPAGHGFTPSATPNNPFADPKKCRVMLARYVCCYTREQHDPALPPEDIDVFGYRRTPRSMSTASSVPPATADDEGVS